MEGSGEPMRTVPLTLALVSTLALAQTAQAPNLRLTPVPNATLVRQQWTAEFEYPQTQAQRAYEFHDGSLRGQGWQRVTSNRTGTGDDLEYEAEYRRGNVRAELQVDQDGGTAEVELEVYASSFGNELNLGSPPNLRLSSLDGAAVRDQSWKLSSLYRGTTTAAVYTHYDRALTGQGGRRTAFDKDDGEYDVDYQVNGVKTNLEVEREGDGVSAELEYEPS